MIFIGMKITENQKPFVYICSFCQKENAEVNAAVIGNKDKFSFSHGYCERHYKETISTLLKNGEISAEDVSSILSKPKKYLTDLKQHPEIAAAYIKGLSTPELIQQAQQTQQTE